MSHFVYRAYDEDGMLLYVGCSSDVDRRMCQHRTESAWFPLLARLERTEHPDLETALTAERNAIKAGRPLFNTVHNPDCYKPIRAALRRVIESCPQGHPYTPENTMHSRCRGRYYRACRTGLRSYLRAVR